jgi:hypothetical protein
MKLTIQNLPMKFVLDITLNANDNADIAKAVDNMDIANIVAKNAYPSQGCDQIVGEPEVGL